MGSTKRRASDGGSHVLPIRASKTPDLSKFGGAAAYIRRTFDRALAGGGRGYFSPNAELRRAVYKVGLRYSDAQQVHTLRDYVNQRDDRHWGASENVFFWVARLASTSRNFCGMSESSWSKTVCEMEVARRCDIEPRYLDHFISQIGGYAAARIMAANNCADVPSWVEGLTRRFQSGSQQ